MTKRNCFFPIILELPLLLYRNKYDENALVGFKCQTSKRFESRFFGWLRKVPSLHRDDPRFQELGTSNACKVRYFCQGFLSK